MPVRINLKELFNSDSQSITVDKLNFNFNKLLELGIGLPGEKGITGPQGGVGPAGIQGPIGEDGNKWFVGTGDPNLQVFPDLENEDFYLDTDSSTIWQYNSISQTWSIVVDFENVVNNYLDQFGITFIRGFGTGSPDDSRYIIFPNRGNTVTDKITDSIGGSSKNDILFLSNFNEKLGLVGISNFPSSTNDLYNAIQKIYTDNTSGVPGRYHLELGSLFLDSNGSLDNKLSDLKHNLKFRHVVDDLGGSPSFPLTNNYIYLGKISLSKIELGLPTDIDYNSALEIITTKYNNEGGPIVRGEVTARFGSKEALGEYFSGLSVDGLSIDIGSIGGKIGIGIAKDISSARPQADGKDFLMLEHDSNIEGVFIKGLTFQDLGSIEQLSTGEISIKDTNPDSNYVEAHWLNQGIAIAGTKLIMVTGEKSPADLDSVARISLYDISNPISPIADYITSLNSFTEAPDKFSMPQPTYKILGPGLVDVQIAGEYAYFVNNQDDDTSAGLAPGVGFIKEGCRFQIGKIYNDFNQFDQVQRVSYINSPELQGAYQLAIRGKWAWVICNADRTVSSNNRGRLTSIDISDPLVPFVSDSYLDSSNDSRYIAMDVSDNIAAVLSSTITAGFPGTWEVDLRLFDITDPSSFSSGTPKLTSSINRLLTSTALVAAVNPARKFGGLKVLGKYSYIAWNNDFWVYDIQVANATTPLKISQTSLGIDNSNPSDNTYAIDLEVVGTTAYVLAYDEITDPANPGVVIKIDISNPASPLILSTSRISDIAKPSKIKYSGKYLYVTSATDSTTLKTGGLHILEVDGIKSPGAQIDSIRTSALQVDKNATVQENLSVNHSLNVGPGGIYVDAGQGITSDGVISTTKNFQKEIVNKSIDVDLSPSTLDSQVDLINGYGVVILGSNNKIRNSSIVEDTSASSNYLYGTVHSISFSDLSNLDAIYVNAIGTQQAILPATVFNSVNSQNTTYESGVTANSGVYISNTFNGDSAVISGGFVANTGTGVKYGIRIIGDELNELDGDLDIGGIYINSNESITHDWRTDGSNVYNLSPKNENVISSGSYNLNTGIWGGGYYLRQNWIRVGNVVQVTFQGRIGTSVAGTYFYPPHLGAGTINYLGAVVVSNNTGDAAGSYNTIVAGYGIVDDSTRGISTTSYGRCLVAVDPSGPGYNSGTGYGERLRFIYTSRVTTTSQEVGDDSGDDSAYIHGSYSYTIS